MHGGRPLSNFSECRHPFLRPPKSPRQPVHPVGRQLMATTVRAVAPRWRGPSVYRAPPSSVPAPNSAIAAARQSDLVAPRLVSPEPVRSPGSLPRSHFSRCSRWPPVAGLTLAGEAPSTAPKMRYLRPGSMTEPSAKIHKPPESALPTYRAYHPRSAPIVSTTG